MRIALIGCTANPRAGGMGRALFDHAVALAEAGQEVTVYALPPFPEPPPGPPLSKGGTRGFIIGKAAWGVRFNPPLDAYDVVHVHLPFFGVAEVVARWKHATVIPGERSETRDPGGNRWIPDIPTGSGFRDDKQRPILVATYHMDAIGTGLKRLYFNWWYRHRFKKVLDACDAIAVTSRAYARESWLPKAGVDVDKCEEILLRVDTGRFRPNISVSQLDSIVPIRSLRSLSGLQNDNYFLFVGALDRAHYFKRLSLLLRAFRSLDPRFRGDDSSEAAAGMTEKTAAGMTELPRLVVVGAGELLGQYKKEAAALGIADRVQFTGGVSDEELARWYAGARALVLPSTDRSEAFGLVLIEAMACGTPVIASDLPGVREVVERVAGGMLVSIAASEIAEPVLSESEGSPRSGPRNDILTAALQQMWQHPWTDNERAALAARAAAIYSRATLAEQLLKWYNQTHVPSR